MKNQYSELGVIKKINSAIVLTNTEDYAYLSSKLLKNLISKQKMAGIYVSTNKDFNSILEDFKKQGIDKSKVQIIATGKNDAEGLTRIKSPGSLTELSILMTKNLNTGRFKFIIFDLINGTTLYNEVDTTTRFFYYLMKKSKILGIKAIAIGINDPKIEKMTPTISQLCDKVIKI
ncbi:MAG: hypothetical protein ABII22_00865 [Candidatus Micrarchaeota archaeon]